MTTTDEAPPRAKQARSSGRGADGQTKSRRPAIRPRGSLIAALDIGTTKICCFIARVEDDSPACSASAIRSRAACATARSSIWRRPSASILNAVHAAEQMAGETIERVVVEPVGRLLRLAHHQGRDRRHRARDRRWRYAAGARARLSDARARRSPDHPFGPGRVLDRRQPRHSRPARHVRRAARRQYACRDRERGQRAQPHLGVGRSHLEIDALVVSPMPPGSPASSRTRSVSA